MGKVVGRKICIDPHYIQEFEGWLTSMAKKGFLFDHMDKKKCYFEKAEPKEVEYRIYIQGSLLTPEKRQEFEEAGYEYIAASEDVHVFAVARGAKRFTIYRDIDMETAALRKYRRKQYREIAVNIGIAAAMLAFLYFISAQTFPLATVLIINTIISVPFILLGVLQLVYNLQNIICITKQIRLLEQREDIRYQTNWNSQMVLHRGMQVLGIGILLLPITFNIIQFGAALVDLNLDGEPKKRPAVVATLKEVEQNNSLVTEGYCPGIETRLYESLGIKKEIVYREELLKKSEDGPVYLNESTCYSVRYWELRADWMLERFMKEQLQIITKRLAEEDTTVGNVQSVSVDGIDAAFYLPTSRGDEYAVIIAKGKTIVYTYYRGGKTYEELLSIMRNKLIQNI